VTPDRLAAHEAGHAAACVALGVPVLLVDTIGDDQVAGRVHHGLEVRTRGDARDRMQIILCGLIESADTWDDMPTWPLRRDASTDEANLSDLADALGLDDAGYQRDCTDALNLTLRPDYRCTSRSPACSTSPRASAPH
jgi:hypothetical protein